MFVDGVEAPVKVGKENNGYEDRQIKRTTGTYRISLLWSFQVSCLWA